MKKFFYLSVLFMTLTTIIVTFNAGMTVRAQDATPILPYHARDAQPVDWSDEPGAMPALIGGQKAERPMILSEPVESAAPQSISETTIDIWYGDPQKFGQIGNPQQWINILGNVSDPGGVKSLAYSLNGGPKMDLTMGMNNPRLIKTGDFNIEIDRVDPNLINGVNTVTISAVDINDQETQKNVAVNYTAGQTSPIPFDANWGASSNIQDIAQVVDGKWSIQGGKLSPVEIGYDRLIAIGDETWTDYEVTVPLTVKSLDDSGFTGPSNGPGVGLILRWQGHLQTPNSPPEQPLLDWRRVGGLGWYRWAEKNGAEGLELRGYDYWIGTSTDKVWQFNVPYIMKMSVQSVPESQAAYYRLKFWPATELEPVAWDQEGLSSESASQSGSTLIVAHHVEVEFGQVEIRALDNRISTLTSGVNGNGNIVTDPEGQTEFSYGERVILFANPGEDFAFDGWSGDYSGDDNPLTINMTSDVTVTANFVEALPGTLTVETSGEGTVSKTPDKGLYDGGEMVTVMAIAKLGNEFLGWSGDLIGKQNPAMIQISGNMSVTALFAPVDKAAPYSDNFDMCTLDTDLWTTVDPAEDGVVMMIDSAAQLTVPAGDAHTMWGNNRDALRIMQDTTNSNFLLEVKFNTIPVERYQLEGILVEQDEDNWLRFDFFSDTGQVKAFAGGTINGAPVTKSLVPVNLDGATELYMRVSRNAETLTQSFSLDGTSWQGVEPFDQNMVVNRVGVFAGNEPDGSAPEFVASVDYFRNVSYPSGGSYELVVDSVGEGVVQVTPPDIDAYACGQTVDLEAIAADSGWSFDSWSGDASGSSNPLTVTIDANKSISALFVEGQQERKVMLPVIMQP